MVNIGQMKKIEIVSASVRWRNEITISTLVKANASERHAVSAFASVLKIDLL